MCSNKRVALITGGSKGIGKAISLELARNRINTVFTYHNDDDAAEKLLMELESLNIRPEKIKADVADYKKAKEIVNYTFKEYGRLDILINNAGISIDKPFFMMNEQDWDQVLETNLKGTFNYSKAVIFPFVKQKAGNIINISSLSGIIAFPGQINYSASKAAMLQFTRTLAKEVGMHNIRVNAIAPGYIETDLNSHVQENRKNEILSRIVMGRFGKAEEIARIVMFLLSDAAAYITGQTIIADGGLSL